MMSTDVPHSHTHVCVCVCEQQEKVHTYMTANDGGVNPG